MHRDLPDPFVRTAALLASAAQSQNAQEGHRAAEAQEAGHAL